jgi:hypothetical protein
MPGGRSSRTDLRANHAGASRDCRTAGSGPGPRPDHGVYAARRRTWGTAEEAILESNNPFVSAMLAICQRNAGPQGAAGRRQDWDMHCGLC